MDKRLFRNEHEKVVAGVSSGIAEYMEIDVTIVRLLFVLSTIFLVGTGILVYLVMWIVVPVNYDPAKRFSKFNDFYKGNPNPFQSSNPFTQPPVSSTVNDGGFGAFKKQDEFKPYQKNNQTGRTVGGLFLLVIGLYFLMDEFHFVPFWFSLGKLWPLIFVAIGLSFLLKSKGNSAWEDWKRQQENPVEPEPVVPSGNDPVTPVTDPVTPVTQTPAVPVTHSPVTDAPVTDGPIPPATDEGTSQNTGTEGNKIDDRFTKKDIS
ncbi:PspC domain-containing protein [Pedobacter metabolipauper]|uniref:Phage shock protein C (PspC) family protein n=1 Tax=Pedobacter metabolipauper TaxID=425513 RepID=A0A4R6SX51_9SPHI|nr:PspC domain-containing protein [Pedobacter metabolipauper]TDQ08742.1 phage shock protein C (PspC) family protein [Pedobacter metabolipauper]